MSVEKGLHDGMSVEKGLHDGVSVEKGLHDGVSVEKGLHDGTSVEKGLQDVKRWLFVKTDQYEVLPSRALFGPRQCRPRDAATTLIIIFGRVNHILHRAPDP